MVLSDPLFAACLLVAATALVGAVVLIGRSRLGHALAIYQKIDADAAPPDPGPLQS